MSLLDVYGAINDQITANLAPAQAPIFRFADSTKVQDAPPRIVYIPRSERITGPQGQGGDGVSNPRPLFTRIVGMEIHIWGADYSATEDLLNLFVQSVHGVLWGAYELHGGNWNIANETVNKLGVVYVLNMTWKIPITRAPDTYALVTAIPITPQIVTS